MQDAIVRSESDMCIEHFKLSPHKNTMTVWARVYEVNFERNKICEIDSN